MAAGGWGWSQSLLNTHTVTFAFTHSPTASGLRPALGGNEARSNQLFAQMQEGVEDIKGH